MWGWERREHTPTQIYRYKSDSINVYYNVIVSVLQSMQKISWRLRDIGSVVKEVRKVVGLDDLKGNFQPKLFYVFTKRKKLTNRKRKSSCICRTCP